MGSLMTVRAAAAELGVHENTIRNWEKRGLIRASVTPTGMRRFSQEDVRRMRDEMWTQFAPDTTLPDRTERAAGQVVDGELMPDGRRWTLVDRGLTSSVFWEVVNRRHPRSNTPGETVQVMPVAEQEALLSAARAVVALWDLGHVDVPAGLESAFILLREALGLKEQG